MTEHKTLAGALIAAQQAFGGITKDKRVKVETKVGRSYSYTYADLGSVLEAVMPALHENGLTLLQCMDIKDGQPVIRTHLVFTGDTDMTQQFISYTPIVWADKTDTQKYGGAITYCRRYALMAMLCLSAEDDDGATARMPARATDVADTQQHYPAQERKRLTDDQFDEKVRQMIANKDKQMRLELIEDAEDMIGRWCVLVNATESIPALEWIEANVNHKGIDSQLVRDAIEKRRAQLNDPNHGRVS
jgi:hypothetical protein